MRPRSGARSRRPPARWAGPVRRPWPARPSPRPCCAPCTRNLTSRSRFFFTSARRPSTVPSLMPRRLGQRVVDRRQVLRLDLLHRDHEVGFLAGHVVAVVVGRELQREGLALADLHAAHGGVELLEHLAFADDELEVVGLAAGEGLAVDLAFEVDRDAVGFDGAFVRRRAGRRCGAACAGSRSCGRSRPRSPRWRRARPRPGRGRRS